MVEKNKNYVQSDNGKMRAVKPKDHKMEMEVDKDWSLPHITFTHEQLPEMKDWKVGEKYTLEVEVEMETIGKHSGTLIVKGVKAE